MPSLQVAVTQFDWRKGIRRKIENQFNYHPETVVDVFPKNPSFVLQTE
jgi:hypothetical protein